MVPRGLTPIRTDGLRLVVLGAVIGLAGAIAAARYVENQLFGIAPRDPLTLLGVCAVLLAVAIAACVIPARRAMAVDPLVALRQE